MKTRRRVHGVLSLRMLSGCLVGCSVLTVACGADTSDPAKQPGPVAHVDLVAGDGQAAVVGTELASPLVVRVTDTDGTPIPGQVVNFRVVSGNGSVYAGSAITNVDGECRERWTLGTATADSQRVEARAADATTGAATLFGTFRATALAGPAAKVAVVTPASGARSGMPFLVQPSVSVLHAFGNLRTSDNSTVVKISVSGGGTIVGPATATAAAGVATSTSTGIAGALSNSYTVGFSAAPGVTSTQTVALTAGSISTIVLTPGM